MHSIYLKLIMFFFVINISANEEECPHKCTCKRNGQKDGYLKMVCGEKDKIFHLDELELLNIASELVQLNLSNNNLKSFTPKVQLDLLQKLDLSKNQLSELQANQFTEVPNLRRLDISVNNIKHIDLLAFNSLRHLERLKLNENQISSIALGTFTPLEVIKQLDISNNPLACDCSLLWLLDWSQKQSVKLVSNPKCNSPALFKGQPLRKLKIGHDIHCQSPVCNSGVEIIELKPNKNQVVFEGDSMSLQCFAPSISDSYDESKIEWALVDSDPKLYAASIRVENEILHSAGRILSTLTIHKLNRNHTGEWKCSYSSRKGNHSKTISIVVISDETKYCPMTITSNNKGSYNWPRTIVNYVVSIPCESPNVNYGIEYQKASFYCSQDGEWKNLNTSMCSYISDTTKILEQFSIVNTSIEESAKHFRNYTLNQTIFKDTMDLFYAVTTIENYISYTPLEHIGTIGSILMDVINNLMELPRLYLSAGSEYGACKRLLNTSEHLAVLSTSSSFQKTNLALEVFHVKKEGFGGLKCTWFVNPNNRKDSLFSCVSNNLQDISGLQGRMTEASITIPDSLFRQLREEHGVNLTSKAYSILIAMYSSSKFFPIDAERRGREDVSSAVVGAKLVNITVKNLSEPVYVMLRTPPTPLYEVAPFTPVRWDPLLANGSGNWSSEGCHFTHELEDHVVFSCDSFGYFGLLQDVSHLQNMENGQIFKLTHPAVYVGTFILLTSFLIVIITYLLCYATIHMPKKAKHSLVNTWIAISSLSFMYVFGIYQTEEERVCQMVGMLLHYFTLCSLLWMCVGVNCMYKRLSKNDVINLQDDDLPSDQPIQKPILGLYLVGWGIGMIICGLSAAINMKEYASRSHCFLRTGPALSALYIPFAILIVFLLVFFLLIKCAICNLDANGHLSEGTQATENVDLDLLEPNFPNVGSRSVRSASTKTASSEVEDPEHAPSAQLKAYVIFLFIYLMTWLSAAFAAVPPFQIVYFDEDLFSIAFAILATTLSAFTLFFYCFARNDVRTQWVVMARWVRRKRACYRSRNVSDNSITLPQIQAQPLPLPPVSNIDGQIVSRSTSRSSSHTKTNSHTSNILRGAVDLNGSFSDNQGAKINNVNLVMLHRAQYRSNIIPNIIENPTNAAEVFYNPHQSTVARKFFKRQKRHMLKKTNFVKPPRDLNSDTASMFSEPMLKVKNNMEQKIFGTNSKVNNTNIHVERVRNIQENPNVFSESTEDFLSLSNVPVENTELLRQKELLRHKTKKRHKNTSKSCSERVENKMRSVSQQCTLDYSSETISDSILDKTSPDKSLLPSQEMFMLQPMEVLPSVCPNTSSLSMLTDNDPNYCQINEMHPARTRNDYFHKSELGARRRKGKARAAGPSDRSFSIIDSSVCGESTPTLYVNPSRDGRVGKEDGQSRASSVSASELDELYQQIRRGPQRKRSHNLYSMSHASPCLSDSEINSFISDIRRHKTSYSHEDFEHLSDDVETTV